MCGLCFFCSSCHLGGGGVERSQDLPAIASFCSVLHASDLPVSSEEEGVPSGLPPDGSIHLVIREARPIAGEGLWIPGLQVCLTEQPVLIPWKKRDTRGSQAAAQPGVPLKSLALPRPRCARSPSQHPSSLAPAHSTSIARMWERLRAADSQAGGGSLLVFAYLLNFDSTYQGCLMQHIFSHQKEQKHDMYSE